VALEVTQDAIELLRELDGRKSHVKKPRDGGAPQVRVMVDDRTWRDLASFLSSQVG